MSSISSILRLAVPVAMIGLPGPNVWAQSSSDSAPIQLLEIGRPHPIVTSGAIVPAPSAPFTGMLRVTISGALHYCTGTFIDVDVVVTAAHCVQENGSTVRYPVVDFTLDSGEVYTAKPSCVFVPAAWATTTDDFFRVRIDYAFFRTTSAVTTGTPKNIVTSGNPYGDNVTLYGYPSGSGLTPLAGTSEQDVLHPPLLSTKTMNLGFTNGTSGGPWILDSNGKILSVNSSFRTGVYNKANMRIYGPVFDNAAAQLRDLAKAC